MMTMIGSLRRPLEGERLTLNDSIEPNLSLVRNQTRSVEGNESHVIDFRFLAHFVSFPVAPNQADHLPHEGFRFRNQHFLFLTLGPWITAPSAV
jgi:hypothetical protein